MCISRIKSTQGLAHLKANTLSASPLHTRSFRNSTPETKTLAKATLHRASSPNSLATLYTMLLPSALPCDLIAPSHSTVSSPLRRSSRNIAAPSQYHSPPCEDPANIVSIASISLLQTCRRLQSFLSLNRLSPGPVLAPTASTNTRVHKTTSIATTPLKPRRRIVRTPIQRNKRTCADAFSIRRNEEVEEKENRCDRFATPPPSKRQRFSTPPPAPNRGPSRRALFEEDSSDEEVEEEAPWTDDEDRKLVDMVLHKLNLTDAEWDECARALGKKDGQTVTRRWQNLLGNVTLSTQRRKTLREQRKRRRI